MVPRILDGRYQLDASLGAGGQGRVFRGRDLLTKATVAIKLMDQELEDSPEHVARFLQEGRLAARIRDPHLVAALHFGVSDGQRYIVYDFIPGVAPLTALFDRGRMDPWRVCEIALQVLDALDTLHRAGVIHQDVSPGNCLWRERDSGCLEVFLGDLGSASATPGVTGAPRLTREPVGTAYYMAPEMLAGDAWDLRVDLWSLGAVMYALLVGNEVDVGSEEEPLEIPPPALLVPSIPKGVNDLVMGALARADQRFTSAADMAVAIRAAAGQLSPPPTAAPRARVHVAGLLLTALGSALATWGTVRALEVRPTAEAMALCENSAPSSALPPPGPSSTSSGLVVEPSPPASPAEPTPPALLGVQLTATGPTPVNTPTTKPAGVSPARSATRRTVADLPQRLSWIAVERAVKRKAVDLRTCVADEFVSLGVQVSGGHAVLESLDGKAASLELRHHRCVADVVARLRFPAGELAGVVGVALD